MFKKIAVLFHNPNVSTNSANTNSAIPPDLAEELWAHVLSLLNERQLALAGSVCTLFYKISRDPIVQQRVIRLPRDYTECRKRERLFGMINQLEDYKMRGGYVYKLKNNRLLINDLHCLLDKQILFLFDLNKNSYDELKFEKPILLLAVESGSNSAIILFKDQTCHLWDLVQHQSVMQLKFLQPMPKVSSMIKFNSKLVAVDEDKKSLHIWDTITRKYTNIATSDGSIINCMTTLNENTLITGSSTGKLQFYDLKENKRVHTIQLPGSIASIASLQNNRVAVGSSDCFVYICDALTYKQLKSLKGTEKAISITPLDENHIASVDDSLLCIWDLNTDKWVKAIAISGYGLDSILKLDNGSIITLNTAAEVNLWTFKLKPQPLSVADSLYNRCNII